jgi:diguanylate cyclase (GGDEF)-like protein/PAS domain S-box-containing protein
MKKPALEKQELYKTLTESSFAGIYVVQEGKFRYLNKNAASYAGYAPDELVGRQPGDIIHPEDKENVQRDARAMLLGKKASPNEFRVLTKDGEIRWIMETIVPITWEGKPAILGNSMDVTERKQVERALQESEQRFRTLIETTKDLVFIVNTKGCFSYANSRFKEMIGHEAQELRGKPFTFVIAPESTADVFAHFKIGMKGQDVPAYEALLLHKNGKRIPVEFVTTTMRGTEGETIGRFGIGRDITERKRAEEATREAHQRLFDIVNFLPDATFAVDLEGRVIAWNLAIEEMTGVKKKDMIGKDDYEYARPFYGVRRPILIDLAIKPDADIEKTYSSLSRDKESIIAESVSRHLIPGQDVFLWIKASPIYDASGNIIGAIESIRDITRRKQAEDNLRQSEERYRAIIENIGDGYYEVDLKGDVTFLNDAALRIISLPESEVQGLNFKSFVTGEDAAVIFSVFHQVYLTGMPFRGLSWRVVRPDGKEQHLEISVSLIRDAADRPNGFRGIMHDITERRKAEKAIQHMAYHDPLTGLPNRLLFYDRFSQIMAHARRNQEQFAVIMMDLDKFKEINDRLGHDVGDQLLRSVSERLSSQMRDGDTVARFGGDEFLLLLPGMKQIEDLDPLGQKVLQAFQQPFAVSGQALSICASIGIAVFPDDGSDRDTLVQKADFAMYRAKSVGGNRWTR